MCIDDPLYKKLGAEKARTEKKEKTSKLMAEKAQAVAHILHKDRIFI